MGPKAEEKKEFTAEDLIEIWGVRRLAFYYTAKKMGLETVMEHAAAMLSETKNLEGERDPRETVFLECAMTMVFDLVEAIEAMIDQDFTRTDCWEYQPTGKGGMEFNDC